MKILIVKENIVIWKSGEKRMWKRESKNEMEKVTFLIIIKFLKEYLQNIHVKEVAYPHL